MQACARTPLGEQEVLAAEWEAWLRRKRYALPTVRDYVRVVRRLFRSFPNVAPEMITAEHIERHLARHSPGSFVTEVERLRAFFKWLQRHKRLIRTNPCASVDKPAPVNSFRPAFLPEQFNALCRAAHSVEAAAAFHLMYHSGLRINELVHIRVDDLDLARRLLYVRFGKGARRSGPRARWTVLDARSVPVLAAWLRESGQIGTDAWLLGMDGRRRALKTIARWFSVAKERAGLPRMLTPHSLRHGFFKRLKLLGVSLEIAANLGGHVNLETTRRIYGRLTPEEMRDVVERAAEGFREATANTPQQA